jgi:hypothetical protein
MKSNTEITPKKLYFSWIFGGSYWENYATETHKCTSLSDRTIMLRELIFDGHSTSNATKEFINDIQ